jgi:cytochrome c oxidase cbb3-type subunit 3
MKKLTRSKEIEQEADVMLDHNYDGIRELDNVLPPWWVYLFYSCIVFAAVYLIRFHVMGADNQAQEFDKEVAAAKIAVDEYNKTAPDQMSKDKVTLLTDAASIAAGKTIFTTNCVACHRPDAGGQIGPNLTDDMWINGGGIKNVFNTIMEGGRDGKGMVSWKATIKPSDIQKVSSYVLSLQGSKPVNPKPTEPEAKKWVDEKAPKDAAKPAATDTTKVVAKEVAVK